MKSCVTIALVPEITKGPWIYWESIEKSIPKAKALGFDAVELFTPGVVDSQILKSELEKNDITLAAVGTGAGKVLKGLTLTDTNASIRAEAIAFISDMIRFGAEFGAPAIIGSMQGVTMPEGNKDESLQWLREALETLGECAKEADIKLIYEPLNRYETNLFNTLEEAASFVKSLKTKHVVLLADLFHMNIEEDSMGDAIRNAGDLIGHVHFADSNRNPIGCGHTGMDEVAKALKDINYSHYISAEAFPYPNPDQAAAQTIKSFHQYFKQANKG